MNSDGLGRSQDEPEDGARYVWAQGKRNIRSAAYHVSELAREGRPITEADARKLHWNLIMLWGLLDEATVGSLGPEPTSVEEELFRYDPTFNFYSDGTPVASLVQIGGSDGSRLPDELYEGDIGQHGLPPGWEVIVLEPPHRRGTTEHVEDLRTGVQRRRGRTESKRGWRRPMSIAEDHKKHVYALGARDVRRLTAVMQRLDLDPVTYNEIVCYLDQFEARLLSLAFVSCHLQGGEEVVSLVDHQGLYDDGRPVATTIRSDDGFVTMVHDPDPELGESSLGPE